MCVWMLSGGIRPKNGRECVFVGVRVFIRLLASKILSK